MSVRTMARVWAASSHSGSHLLMLLAIADFADDDGNAYPAVSTLAEKCRMKPRNAQVILGALRRSGELEVRENEGPRGTNLYRIAITEGVQGLTGVQRLAGVQRNAPGGAKACAKPLQRLAPKPSGNHQEPERGSARRFTGAIAGSRIPENWQPSDSDVDYCRTKRPDLDPADVAETFLLYWRQRTGKEALKADWSAAFKRWVRNERQPAALGHVLHSDDVFEATQ